MSAQNQVPILSLCSLKTDTFLSLAVCLATPTILGRVAGSHVHFFKDIYHQFTVKPSFVPSNSLFRPIWTLLYLSIGLASYLVYQTGVTHNVPITSALAYYTTQLLLNLCWPAVFFRYRNYKVSLFIIAANLVTAGITAAKFYYINQLAGYLLVPYLIWLTFSGYINKRVWRANENNVKLMAINQSNYNEYLTKAKLDDPVVIPCKDCGKTINSKLN